jgi:6-pyruvoyltetrahydropterin/6-carboxytetrahydropterin synthase
MTYIVQKEIEFDAGHRVHRHGGKCRNLHGHRYKVEVQIETQSLIYEGSSTGMVLDFGEVKQWLVEDVEQIFDHKLILSVDDPLAAALTSRSMIDAAHSTLHHGPWTHEIKEYHDGVTIVLIKRTPTAENLACLISQMINRRLLGFPRSGALLRCVRVWETPKSLAIWEA